MMWFGLGPVVYMNKCNLILMSTNTGSCSGVLALYEAPQVVYVIAETLVFS